MASDEVAMFWNGPSSPVMLTTNGETYPRQIIPLVGLFTISSTISLAALQAPSFDRLWARWYWPRWIRQCRRRVRF